MFNVIISLCPLNIATIIRKLLDVSSAISTHLDVTSAVTMHFGLVTFLHMSGRGDIVTWHMVAKRPQCHQHFIPTIGDMHRNVIKSR
jgi:hypothetical protein